VLLAFVAMSGCARAVNAGLGLLGVEGAPEGETVGSEPLAGRVGAEVESVYRRGPELDWVATQASPPAHPTYGFLAGPTPFACKLAPTGVHRVLPVFGSVPLTTVSRIGPLRIGVAGEGPAAAAGFLTHEGYGIAPALVEGASRLGTLGQGCARTVFLHLSLWPPGDPVLVNRE